VATGEVSKHQQQTERAIDMHYKNGRPAQNGDRVVLVAPWGGTTVGILYDAVEGNDTCNGKLAAARQNDPMPNLAECLHIDDVTAVLGHIAPYVAPLPKASESPVEKAPEAAPSATTTAA
jgi:hypothetical protein